MSDILLSAQDLHKSYAGKSAKPALQGVSLTLQAGEIVALLGPNGAGKSTLLQLLTGLFSPDKGRIEVLGFDLQTQASRALAGLGVVFQQSALDLDLSVQANLLFHTDLHGLSRAQAKPRIAQALEKIGMTAQTHAVVRGLSGGTRRKVELVRALLHRPKVLLMDEATAGLDMESRQQLISSVRALARADSVAVLWATHLAEEVKVADRLVLLHQGTVRFSGSVEEFIEKAQGKELPEEIARHFGHAASLTHA